MTLKTFDVREMLYQTDNTSLADTKDLTNEGLNRVDYLQVHTAKNKYLTNLGLVVC